jgi:predicted nucleotidyltransferase
MKPSVALEMRRDQIREILSRSRMRNPRIIGSISRGDDTESSGLLVDPPAGTSFYDLARIELNSRPSSDAKSLS